MRRRDAPAVKAARDGRGRREEEEEEKGGKDQRENVFLGSRPYDVEAKGSVLASDVPACTIEAPKRG